MVKLANVRAVSDSTQSLGQIRMGIEKARVGIAVMALFAMLCGWLLLGQSDAYGCSVEFHCYSVVGWDMTPPEELMGALVQVEAYYGKVPRWASGDFIDDEMWVGFPQLNNEAWVEGGITVGNWVDETTPRYFVARSYGPHKYMEYLYTSGPPYNAWSGLYLDQRDGWGTWCATWAWDQTPDYCFSGFPTSSSEVENGLEVATTTASGVDNNGRDYASAQYMDGVWHGEWNDGVTRAQGYRDKPLCIVDPAPGYTWGSIAYAVPGC